MSGYTRKTTQKKNPQGKAIRKEVEMNLVVDKLYDQTCMEFERDVEDQANEQSLSSDNNTNKEDQVTPTTMEGRQDNNNTDEEREVNQLLYDQRCLKEAIQVAIQDDESSSSEADIIESNEKHRWDDEGAQDGANKKQRVYYTDNDNIRIEDSDSDGDRYLPDLMERHRNDYSSSDDDSDDQYSVNEKQQVYYTDNVNSSIEDSNSDGDTDFTRITKTNPQG